MFLCTSLHVLPQTQTVILLLGRAPDGSRNDCSLTNRALTFSVEIIKAGWKRTPKKQAACSYADLLRWCGCKRRNPESFSSGALSLSGREVFKGLETCSLFLQGLCSSHLMHLSAAKCSPPAAPPLSEVNNVEYPLQNKGKHQLLLCESHQLSHLLESCLPSPRPSSVSLIMSPFLQSAPYSLQRPAFLCSFSPTAQ